jgi:hypothetical protein
MTDPYQENGFLVRRGLVPPDLIAELNERFFAVAEERVAAAPNMQVVRKRGADPNGYAAPEAR